MKRIKQFFASLFLHVVAIIAAQHERRFVLNVIGGEIPDLEQLRKFNVNRPGQVEVVRSSLYDFQAYAQAGQTSLQFFQVPQGQSNKTLADTNMTNAGALPSPQSFLIETIEIYFLPGNAISATGAIAAENWNDVYDVFKSGWLDLFIGSKSYLQEAPIGKFPPRCGVAGVGALADTTSAAASRVTVIDYASFGGPTYQLEPNILLVPTQNFKVSLNWPTAVAISVAGRIGISLGGILYRNSQ